MFTKAYAGKPIEMVKKVARFLVTTADERTWKLDRPVVFLGEWCLRYDRKHLWSQMDAVVARPYGLGQTQKDSDHMEARAIEAEIFPCLCEVLNHHHGTQHGPRFWRMVIGHWFSRCVDVLFNRVRTLEQCLHEYEPNTTVVIDDHRYSLAPLDSYAAIWAFGDERWNHVLYARLLQLMDMGDCIAEKIPGDDFEGYRRPESSAKTSLKSQVVEWGYKTVRGIMKFFIQDTDGLVLNSYLSKYLEIKLQVRLGQFPQMHRSPNLAQTALPNSTLRISLSKALERGICDSDLSRVVRTMVFELMPVCYLEGFASLAGQVAGLAWPKQPRFIFTSNNFDTDEVFKLWAATKAESGATYCVGQHGNNYGVSRNHLDPSIEELTADRFFTWGWLGELPQHVPAFIFKTAGRPALQCNPSGGLLLIEVCLPQRINTWDSTSEFSDYFSEQQAFVRKLDDQPKKNLTIRLHGLSRQLYWSEEERWLEQDPELKIERGDLPMQALISCSRLIVHSYDSTGILETLSQDIPTLAFWQNGFDHLRESAKPYYQLLVDAGIVHLTPESIAAKVNEVWDSIPEWWTQANVQGARKRFCDQYAKSSKEPVREMKALLASSF
ncbi:LIC12162 family protein [Polaromonas sp. AER18D-145]|uniref:LIC12162 family transferase n=1 Tax=Polaromonas sp. AER18D-145 TaxID=1977060 RepID=UPI001142C27B|nr:LIC12162 family protein [Polaromonas sp. AER18D-145]